jgi:two-component system phosphate regulon sensor histidine kinase PhoR
MKTRSDIPRTFIEMKKNVFLLIVMLNSLALIGIICIQFFWIREAFDLLKQQFDGSVRVALKGVVNELHDFESLKANEYNKTNPGQMISFQPDIRDLNLFVLEYKLSEEFKRMNLIRKYEFAIVDKRDSSIIIGRYDQYSKELRTSLHQVDLVGFKNSEKYYLSAWFPGEKRIFFRELASWIVMWIIFVLVLIIGFPVSIYIYNHQKKLSGMKTDFINNMTHEFKTPIATISLASEMLLKKSIQSDPEKTQRYAKIIFDENIRLQNHVEQILSVSQLERGKFYLKKKETDIHKLIDEVIANFSLIIKEREGKLRTHYCATQFVIDVDRSHITNVINNLLDNANKYSFDKPWIRIGTQSTDNGLIITVEDKGTGIPVEHQKLIFRNLYRIPTGDIYNVQGFGIGLYYVKTIVEAHGGHINIKSEVNKGSRFDVYLPFNYNSSKDERYNQTKDSSS